jgi:hypothetical protein
MDKQRPFQWFRRGERRARRCTGCTPVQSVRWPDRAGRELLQKIDRRRVGTSRAIGEIRMLNAVEIRAPAPVPMTMAAVARLFPSLPARASLGGAEAGAVITAGPGAVTVPATVWEAPRFDPLALDDALAAGGDSLAVRVEGSDDRQLHGVVLQVLTRCQRLLRGTNRHSADPIFARVLELHRGLHDLRLPLVAADYHHTIDTWRWTLRLDPDAGLAVQVAALFHDVERLTSEPLVRIEQHAADYRAFKEAHAAAGGQITETALARIGAPPALRSRVAELVATHEQPHPDEEAALLNEADALSFFSLNAPGFARHYGPEHTARKVAYTLRRLGPRGRAELGGIRHRADIAALIARESTP